MLLVFNILLAFTGPTYILPKNIKRKRKIFQRKYTGWKQHQTL